MNTNTDITGQLKNYIDKTDDLIVKNILEMLEAKEISLWFRNEAIENENENEAIDMINDKTELSYEQVKQLYPHWFSE